MNTHPLTLLIDDLLRLSLVAGDRVMEIYCSDNSRLGNKTDGSPLTLADLASNDVIMKGLSRLTPDIPILTEEAEWSGSQTPPIYWAVDPLDGTKEFIGRNGEFTVNIALVENGRPTVGVVNAPALGRAWFGVVGGSTVVGDPAGAFSVKTSVALPSIQTEMRPLTEYQSNLSDLGTCIRSLRAAVSRSHGSDVLQAWLESLPFEVEVLNVGSSLKLCYVAEGVVDFYPRVGATCIWDIAAGHAILLAAGGSLVKFDFLELTTKRPQTLSYPNPSDPVNPSFLAVAGDELIDRLLVGSG